jgi:putative transposase
LVRQLSDDEFQFEDTLTRRPRTMRRFQILKDIEGQKYSVVVPALQNGTAGALEQIHDTSPLPESIQQQLDRRYAYVIAMNKMGITPGSRGLVPAAITRVAAQLEDKKPPSPSTVLAWARRYRDSCNNARALVSKNYRRVSPKRATEAMEALIREKIRKVYLTKDRYSLTHTCDVINTAAELLVAEGKLDPKHARVSPSTVGRWVAELDRYQVISRRYGPARAKLLCRTPMGNEYPEYPFEQIEVDHTPLDWVVLCDRTGIPLGRPLLTATLCAATGYCTGLYLSFYGAGLSSVSGILRATIAIKDGICRSAGTERSWLASGVPDTLTLDNGLEFHATAFRRMARDIAMDLTYAGVRTPWSKPHVEGFFADLGFLTLTAGRVRKRVTNVLDLDPRTTAAITFTNLVKGLVRYVVDVYPMRINERKAARPYDLMMEGIEKCPPAGYLTSTDSIRLATALSRQLTVNQGGVELQGIPYGDAELFPIRKAVGGNSFKTNVKWDPDDIDQIWVQHPITQEWVCSPSRWPHHTRGRSWNQHLLVRKFMRKQLKLKGAEDDYRRASVALHEFWMEVTRTNSRADAKLAAQFSGVTSARVLAPPTDQPIALAPPPISKADEAVAAPSARVIPEFNSFVMR